MVGLGACVQWVSARSEASADSLLIVDSAADGCLIGIGITAPGARTLERINDLLHDLVQHPLPEAEFASLRVL